MKATYDEQTDVMYLELRRAKIVESDEVTPGIIVDYDARGAIVAVEILDATRRTGRVPGDAPGLRPAPVRARPTAAPASRPAVSRA